ncbi:SCP2 sterol-binding domain-containing protein [Planococcus beigongshangi]|uniref:SCP2 sterol-binding domain-containing protein n=1 Tax=Planococcus beigongshangi TaxID=2782536 RepID=UPI00193B0BFB|nr:SCP2 sterol-binding domain-containing protein [Planococcus beigongshangi]
MTNATLNETMQQIEKEINQNPEPIASMDTVYQFEIDGEAYQLQLKDGQAKILEHKVDPNCTLVMSYDNFNKFLAGKLNGMAAFMTGKLKIQGDITKALKLETIVKQYELDI